MRLNDSSVPEHKQYAIVKFPRGGRLPAREFGYDKILTAQDLPVVALDGEVLLETAAPAAPGE